MPARLGHDPPLFTTPDPDLLRDITGIAPEPAGTHVRLDAHGVRSVQRLALDDVGGSLLVGLWPGELKPQARYLYAQGRAGAMIAAARAFRWSVDATPHLAFHTAPPSQRLYLDVQIGVDEYARRWEAEDAQWIGQYDAAEVHRTLWPWLQRRGYATSTDDDTLEDFLRLLGRRPAHLRPGLRLVGTWDPDARRTPGRELTASIRRAVDAILTAAGEPRLADLRERTTDRERRGRNAVSNAEARSEEAERRADEGDDTVISTMNAKRIAEGKAPLSEEQKASVRAQRRRRRAPPA